MQQHHDLLERRVTGALADPVDRALDLPRAGEQAGERVGDGQSQVVVTVNAQDHVAQIRNQLVKAPQIRRVLVRHRVPDGVGDVDRCRALVDRDLAHLGRELDVGAGRVHRRELDVVDVLLGVRDRRPRLSLDVLARGLELVLDVYVGGRDERVDARPRRVLDRVPRRVDVGHVGARQAGDDRALHGARDRLHGFEITGRGDRKARLDHVDPEPRELLRDLQLLLRVQRDAGRLLPVTQGRVEDQYSAWVLGLAHVTPKCLGLDVFSVLVSRLRAAAHALFPPRGEEEKSEIEAERHSADKRTKLTSA